MLKLQRPGKRRRVIWAEERFGMKFRAHVQCTKQHEVTTNKTLIELYVNFWKVFKMNFNIQCVPRATEPGISLIFLPLMRILLADRCCVSQQLGALQTHTADTFLFISHTIRRTTDTHCRHIPLHFSQNKRTPVQISLQYLHWC